MSLHNRDEPCGALLLRTSSLRRLLLLLLLLGVCVWRSLKEDLRRSGGEIESASETGEEELLV